MDKKQELFYALRDNPELRLVAMFSNDGNDDYEYSMGEATKVQVTHIFEYGERIYCSDESDELREIFEDHLFDELYGDEPYSRVFTDEENDELERLAQEKLEKVEWEPVIIVYVSN